MKIGVLCVQGAFIEHINKLKSMGIDTFEIRQEKDIIDTKIDGIILPGGESTVQGKLIKELNLFDKIKDLINEGIPVLATCAGLILIAENISKDEDRHLCTMPITVKRNAYGRQLGSFKIISKFKDKLIPMTFIRAPYVEKTHRDVEVLSVFEEKIVAVKYKNQIGVAFHPELDDDNTIHRLFVDMVRKR